MPASFCFCDSIGEDGSYSEGATWSSPSPTYRGPPKSIRKPSGRRADAAAGLGSHCVLPDELQRSGTISPAVGDPYANAQAAEPEEDMHGHGSSHGRGGRECLGGEPMPYPGPFCILTSAFVPCSVPEAFAGLGAASELGLVKVDGG